jgi:hypothetical protein
MTGGHGHVRPRPDGAKARCGGPALCKACQQELADLKAENVVKKDEIAKRAWERYADWCAEWSDKPPSEAFQAIVKQALTDYQALREDERRRSESKMTPDEINAYAERHERYASEKAEDAPASADMHHASATYARRRGLRPIDNWPAFEAWCRDEWDAPLPEVQEAGQ